MYKFISCPQCGKRICRAELGSSIAITCSNCKTDIQCVVDNDGGVHTLLIMDIALTIKKAANQT